MSLNPTAEVAAWITYPRGGETIRADLDKPKVVFGRASSCEVVLSLKGVSRVHFQTEYTGQEWLISDLNSTNGTFVNQKIIATHPLKDGDRITLGPPGLVPVVLVFHQPRPQLVDDQESVDDALWDEALKSDPNSEFVPHAPPQPPSPGRVDSVDSVGSHEMANGGLDRVVFDEDEEGSSPNIYASIDIEEYNRQANENRGRISPQDSSMIGPPILGGMQNESQDSDGSSISRMGDPALVIGLISQMGNAMLKADSLDHMLEEILKLAFDHLPAERGSIWVVEPGQGIAPRVVRNKAEANDQPMNISRTIVNEAIRNKQAILITDTVDDSRFSQVRSIADQSIRSAICAPLYFDGQIQGFIYVDTVHQWIAFNERHLELLTTLAVFAAVGTEKWRMQEEANREKERRERVRRRIEALLDVATALSSELDTKRLLEKIMVRARKLLGADRCSVFLVCHDEGELMSTVAEGTDTIRVRMDQGLVGFVARSGDVLNIEDAYNDARFNQEVDQRTGYRTKSMLCMPLRNKDGKTIGVTQIINKHGGPFTKEDEELLSAFSAQAAIALENSMLFEETLEVRNYLECILQSINQLVLTLDTHGKLVRSNRPVEPLLGIGENQMTQSCYKEWFGESNTTLVENIERVYRDPKAIYVADDDLQTGDRVISFNYNIVPLLDFEGKQDGVVLVMEDITDQKRVMTTLGRYMSPIVAQKVLDEGGDRLGGIRQNVAVLFSDIRGYTAITESMDAQHVVELLNAYFSLMVDAVFAENGLLDKYIGDALMAVFGVPFPQEDDSIRACLAALKMRTALIEFNEIQKKQGRQPVGIGIGINSGEVISGNIGSERRLEYTCIGDGVNLASRIEGVSKHYGVTIVMTEYTQREVGDNFLTRELDSVRVLGKQQSIRIFELIGTTDEEIAPDFLRSLPHYQAGLDAYRKAQWSAACEHFQRAHQLGKDNPSAILLNRARGMMQTPPPEHWDGIWDMTGK